MPVRKSGPLLNHPIFRFMDPVRQRNILTGAIGRAIALVLLLNIPCGNMRAAPEATLNGVGYIGLKSVAGRLGMTRQWILPNRQMVLQSDWTRLEFESDERRIMLNGIRVYLGYPIAARGSDLFVSESDFEIAMRPILTPQAFPEVPKLYRIVIDPGHGGKDPGTRSAGRIVFEKNLALDISRRLRGQLAARGYAVSMTRDSDEFVELENRAAIANRLGADLFLSIHLNAVGTTSVAGIETYAFTPSGQSSTRNGKLRAGDNKSHPGNRNDPWNALVGYYVQREMVQSLEAPDRGLKRARWEVLKTLNCPGLLIETGFLTNPKEASKMRSSGYREEVATAIANGVFRYQKTLNRIRGLTSVGAKGPDAVRRVPEEPTAGGGFIRLARDENGISDDESSH